MTSRKIKILIPLDNDGIFTYEIWQNYINRIDRAEGVNYYEVFSLFKSSPEMESILNFESCLK